jgi:hypothetical protein
MKRTTEQPLRLKQRVDDEPQEETGCYFGCDRTDDHDPRFCARTMRCVTCSKLSLIHPAGNRDWLKWKSIFPWCDACTATWNIFNQPNRKYYYVQWTPEEHMRRELRKAGETWFCLLILQRAYELPSIVMVKLAGYLSVKWECFDKTIKDWDDE